MQTLATVDDVLSLGVEADEQVVAAMLAKASARFRSEAQHDITVTERTEVLRPEGGRVRLHRVPVVSIDTVNAVARDGSVGVAFAAWTFDGSDTVDLRGIGGVVFNATYPTTCNVWVTWSYGFAVVPEDVRWAVASMVERALSGPAPALTGETIGDYSWRGGSYTASGALSMSADELAVARAYRPRRSTVRAVAG